MTENIKISINHVELDKSSKRLIRELCEQSDPLQSSMCNTMWDIFESLNIDSFTSLKQNVYFADFLRSIGIEFSNTSEVKEPSTSCFSTTEKDKNTTMETVQDAVSLPSLDELLEEAILPNEFLKLFKRLQTVSLNHPTFKVGKTIGDVLKISTRDLSDLQGVGEIYLTRLEQLKTLYQDTDIITSEKDVDLKSIDLEGIILGSRGLNKGQIKALGKLKLLDIDHDIASLLKLNLEELKSKPWLGRTAIGHISSLKQKLKNELQEVALGNIQIDSWESDFLSPIKPEVISIEKLGVLLLEDIDLFFDQLSKSELDIIQKRWGFVENKQTLEEIGKEQHVTRERIRQIASNLNRQLINNLRFTQEYIWEILEPALSPKLPTILEDLYSCFANERNFLEVLSILSGQENLNDYIRPLIKPYILNSYFAENGGPVAYDDIKEYLVECELESVRDVDNAILFLEQQGNIHIDGEKIWPLNLKKTEAAAFVLANHQGGLPWLDIAKHVNHGNFSRTQLSTHRPDAAAMDNPEYIYLAGTGAYKHTKFIDYKSINIESVFNALLSFFDKTNRDTFHLNECYVTSRVLRQQDYYVIRHIVKHFGEEYGFFFTGRSQTDTVGLEPNFTRITQKDVLWEAMNNSTKPLTKNQIAALLKSQSVNHASLYLDQMLESGEIVQVERMLYTTPEQAYKNINLPIYLVAMENLLRAEAKPVDPSVFKSTLNAELSATYSKYFYASIARVSANKKGWFRKHNLYSISPISYKNLTDLMQIYCEINNTLDQNIVILSEHVAITRNTAVIAISNWRKDR